MAGVEVEGVEGAGKGAVEGVEVEGVDVRFSFTYLDRNEALNLGMFALSCSVIGVIDLFFDNLGACNGEPSSE